MTSSQDISPLPTPSLITPINIAEDLRKVTEALDNINKDNVKAATKILKDMQALVQQKQKEVARWERTFAALQKDYNRKLHAQSGQLRELEISYTALQNEQMEHQRRQKEYQASMDQLDEALAGARSEAQRTSQKKRRREKNYNRYYYVPIVNHHLKKKYLRSQTKNARWEDRVREVRTAMDETKHEIKVLGIRLAQLQGEMSVVQTKRTELDSQYKQLSDLLTLLSEGAEFWRDLAAITCDNVAQTSKELKELLDRADRHRQEAREVLEQNPNKDELVAKFKLACLDLQEGDEYAQERWAAIKIDFECVRCHEKKFEWPGVTKDQPDELLCQQCYVIRKKDLARVLANNLREIGNNMTLTVPSPSPSTPEKQGMRQMIKSVFTRSSSTLDSTVVSPQDENNEKVLTPGDDKKKFFGISRRS